MLQVTVEEKNNIAIMHVMGEFYIESIQKMEKIWDEEVAKAPTVIAIDCADLMFIDSSAIGTLVKFLNNAMSKKIRLMFIDLSPSIQQVFKTARLNNFFTITTREKFEREYLI